MADAMFARARELYPERDIRDEDGLSFVEFVRATGASIKETTDNTDGLHGDVVEAQKARLSNTLRTVASKNTVQRRASVASYLREEVLAEMGPEENDDPEMAEQRSNILQHLDGSTNGSGGVGGGGGGGSGSGTEELQSTLGFCVGIALCCVAGVQVLWLATAVVIRRHLQRKRADEALTMRLLLHGSHLQGGHGW